MRVVDLSELSRRGFYSLGVGWKLSACCWRGTLRMKTKHTSLDALQELDKFPLVHIEVLRGGNGVQEAEYRVFVSRHRCWTPT